MLLTGSVFVSDSELQPTSVITTKGMNNLSMPIKFPRKSIFDCYMNNKKFLFNLTE
ncbi:hypothetical protein TUMSATVNIG1_56850 (plasmid) [Vibrio nigripulchritudo]|nr:hypothetical protein VNTUMSATTG_56390 [Vibrio nigripulchritudo]BDU35076.1 hypothetical protein TUMSATVNIG1_56850 [Vibrio nigripulchritudo]